TMIIPTRRLLWLATVPLTIVLVGRGEPEAIGLAWIVLGAVLASFVVDGVLARQRPRLRLDRETPGQLHVDQPDRIGWVVENRSSFPLVLQLSDRVPAGARADPTTLDVKAPPRSRTVVRYELVPSERGMAAFGDLNYRILGPLGLAWLQRRLPARL